MFRDAYLTVPGSTFSSGCLRPIHVSSSALPTIVKSWSFHSAITLKSDMKGEPFQTACMLPILPRSGDWKLLRVERRDVRHS